MFPQIKKHLPIIILLLFYIIFVFLTFKSYGITWDEQAVYDRGKILYSSYLDSNKDERLAFKQSDDDLWPSYNNTYAAILYAFNKAESYEIYHLYNLLFASLVFIFSYAVFYKKYKKPIYSLIAPVFLILNPRFFGDLAANPKDMPFAIFYFLSIASIYLLSTKNLWIRILILGLLFGLSQSIRSVGLSLYIILFLYDLYIWKFSDVKKINFKIFFKFISKESVTILFIFLTAGVFNLLTWPYLRNDFANAIKEILLISRSFPWNGDVFFMGEFYKASELPLYYLPVWLIIGLPIFILISSIGSLFFYKRLKNNEIFILSMLVILINLLLYFILKPVIYNGLRHYLFLLPFFSLLAALFMIELFKTNKKILKKLFIMFVILNSALIIIFNIKIFPYNYIYFNEFVGGVRGGAVNFETDYYAASSMEALRWLAINKKDKDYNVYTCGLPLIYIKYYPKNFTWVGNSSEADFSFCPAALNEYKLIDGEIIHKVGREGIPFNYVIETVRE